MEYRLIINDSQGSWVVITDAPKGKIGYHYRFKPFKATVIKDAYDEADFHYFQKAKDPIPAGTKVIIDNWWQNFYGDYFRINYNGADYDVKPSCIKFIEQLKEERPIYVRNYDSSTELYLGFGDNVYGYLDY